MSRPTCAYFDWNALRHNLNQAKKAAPASKTLAVIKADAYGHGLIKAAQTLDGRADALAVACVEEAVKLREAGVGSPLVLLEGFFQASELPLLVGYNLQSVIHSPHQIEQLEQADLSAPLQIWLKINSGMQRLGFRPEQAQAAWQRLNACTHVAKPINLMTHLACADECENPATLEQCAVFAACTQGLPGAHSIPNSAGILAWPQTHSEWIRPGIMLYGASPFPQRDGVADGLRPVMHLESAIIGINHCRKGDAVGYGGAWRCPQDMPVGVIAIGYGDGYPRHAPAGTPVLINGKRVPLIGRVSMDMLTVDLRSQPNAQPGDPAILWGRGLPAEHIAAHAGTIAYELFTRITGRVRRYDL